MNEPCTPELHEASKLNDAAWSEHEPRGTQSIDFGDEEGVEHWVVANCRRCHSTLYRRVTVEAAIAAVPPSTPEWLTVLRQAGAL